jgi:low affinity Fe/Cu permease
MQVFSNKKQHDTTEKLSSLLAWRQAHVNYSEMWQLTIITTTAPTTTTTTTTTTNNNNNNNFCTRIVHIRMDIFEGY